MTNQMLILQVIKHAPETCPAFNPKYRHIVIDWYEKIDALTAKYGVKVIANWTNHPEHEVYVVYSTPSMDAFMGYMMQPEMMAGLSFCTVKIKLLMTAPDTLAMLKMAK